MDTRDVLYVGRGSRDIQFESEDAERPARFYLVSYPAHATLSDDAHRRRRPAPGIRVGTPSGRTAGGSPSTSTPAARRARSS